MLSLFLNIFISGQASCLEGFFLLCYSINPSLTGRLIYHHTPLFERETGWLEMEETLEKILETYKKNEGNIITILQDIEETFGYIPEEAVNWFSKKLDIPASRFYGIATFYAQFHLKPRGKNIITVCRGTACHVKGSERLINRLLIELDIPPDKDTTNDLKITVEKVNCVGACGIAPVVLINKKVYNKMTADKLVKEVKTLESKKKTDNNDHDEGR